MRAFLTTLAELAGLAAITAGCFLVSIPLALVVGGVALVVIGVSNA